MQQPMDIRYFDHWVLWIVGVPCSAILAMHQKHELLECGWKKAKSDWRFLSLERLQTCHHGVTSSSTQTNIRGCLRETDRLLGRWRVISICSSENLTLNLKGVLHLSDSENYVWQGKHSKSLYPWTIPEGNILPDTRCAPTLSLFCNQCPCERNLHEIAQLLAVVQ